jgi:hypothetical protein
MLLLSLLTQLASNITAILLGSFSSAYGWGSNLRDLAVGAVQWTFFACIPALVTWPIAWMLLRRKEPAPARKGWLATTCILALCFILWPRGLLLLLLTPIAPMLAALITAVRLPVVYNEAGLCYRCGYDLRGDVSGICPECGTPISTATDMERSCPSPTAGSAASKSRSDHRS